MLEHPPHTRIRLEVLPEMEERLQRHPRRLKRAFDIWHYASWGILVGLYSHDAVPEIAPEEQILPQSTSIQLCHLAYRKIVRGSQRFWEALMEREELIYELFFVLDGGREWRA